MEAPDFISLKKVKFFKTPVFILIFLFVFFPIASANPENNTSILTESNGPSISLSPNISPLFQDNGADVEKSIFFREQKLSQNLFTINDIANRKISPTGFIVKPSNETENVDRIQGSATYENNTLSEGSYLIHGSDGITRIYSEDGTESSFAIDAEAAIIPTPSGSTIPSTYSISVPSGSTVQRMGNNTHIIFNNRVLLTISNNAIDPPAASNDKFQRIFSLPAAENGSWIEWVKNSSPYYVVETDATWTIPHSPDLYSHLYVNGAGDSLHPVNFIFNGIQNRGGVRTSILQPVAGFDNAALWIDNVTWQDHWYGSAYIVAPGGVIHSTPIPLNEGDGVIGMISYDPSQKWTVYLFNQGATTQQNSLLFYQDPNFIMNPNSVDLYLTYEGWLCYNNQTACTPDANTLKNDDVRFYSINVNANIDGVLTPVTPIWVPASVPDTYDHPMLTGIYVDLSQVPDRVNLETHRTSFTITPSVSGTGGYISPVTEQTVQWGADSEPFTVKAYQHNIIDTVYIISSGGIVESIGPKSTYTFRNVLSDYQIVAIFKESELTPVSNFVNSHSGNTVSLTDTSSNSPQEWSWDFGDPSSGVLNTATIQNPSHTYRYGGEYTVTLISSNANGAGTTKRYNVSVDGPPPPEAEFSASSTRGPAAPFTVQFNDTSNGFPTRWSWNFGDGGSSTIQNASHTYLANGTYSVALTTTNSVTGSNTTMKTNYITVGPLYATTNGSYTILKFNQTGSTRWTPPPGVALVDYLVVGGGGEGGSSYYAGNTQAGGGGGGGGVLNGTGLPAIGEQTIVVGAGGSGSPATCGARGGNSSFGNATTSFIALGGGGGAGPNCNDVIQYTNGGSGGGGSGQLNANGTGNYPQGNHGGAGFYYSSSHNTGGGGGGATEKGTDASTASGGKGGDGKIMDITGEQILYGSGGGGGASSYTATGGAGGDGGCAGTGGSMSSPSVNASCQGTGAGGGGAGMGTLSHAAGGDGVVILRYRTPIVSGFAAYPTSGPAPLTVRFTDTSTGNPTGWFWDFGDGDATNSTDRNPVHTYWTDGSFTVALTAASTGGSSTTTRARYIHAGMQEMVGVFRNSTHLFILNNGTERTVVNWGLSTDMPVAGDWNGDGMGDVGVFRPSTQRFILNNGTERTVITWGQSTDIPVAGDWNGDGMGDVGVFRPSTHSFILNNGTERTDVNWGQSTDMPVAGDWNGDGMGDVGVFRPSTQRFILNNGTERTVVNWGLSTDMPVAGDWNGDGMGDVGVFRPSTHSFILNNGTERTVVNWGLSTDFPVIGIWN